MTTKSGLAYAGQYVRAGEGNDKTCEFGVTVAEDWRGIGLATRLLESLVRRARRDGYETMEGRRSRTTATATRSRRSFTRAPQ